MSKKKIHIDQLFAEGLENLQIPVFSNDFDTIQDHITPNETARTFQNFELPVTNNDWLSIKAKLEKEREKAPIIPITTESFAKDSFKDFEIAVTDSDWKAIQNKMGTGNKEKMVWWWWLNILIIAGLLGSALNYYIPLKKDQLSSNIRMTGITTPSKVIVSEPTEVKHSSVVQQTSTESNTNNLNSASDNTVVEAASSSTSNKPSEQATSLTRRSTPHAVINHSAIKPRLLASSVESLNSNTIKPTIDKIVSAEPTTPPAKPFVEPAMDTKAPEKTDNSNANKGIAPKIPEEKIQPTPTTPLELISIEPEDTTKKKSQSQTPPLTPPKKLTPVIYFGLNMAYDNGYRKLDNANSEKYNTIRNTADKHSNSFNLGFVAGVQLKNAQFQLGTQFVTQQWSSSYNYTYKVYDSIPVKKPDGTIVGYLLQRGRDTTINASESVTLQKVNIPFMYNQLWKLNSKTQVLAGFGAAINYTRTATGTKMINPATNHLNYYSSLQQFENKWGFSPNLQLGIQRSLKYHFAVQGAVTGSYSITNRFTSAFGARERPYNYGLSIKLLYLLQ
ncbi:MAG: hypothetical protein V4613_13320 [Bacteroidota bacterium]